MQIPQKATLNIGKKGVTEDFLSEVRKRLEKNKLLKIKILKSARGEGKEKIIERVSQEVGGEVTDIRGNTFTLKRND